MKKKCEQCFEEYECRPAKAHISRFCSVRCRCDWEKIHGRIRLSAKDRKTRYAVPEKTFTCEGCGREYKAKGWKQRKFCTRECGMKTIGKLPTRSWTTGLKPDDPRLVKAHRKQSNTLRQKYAAGTIKTWNRGLTAETDERMAKLTAHLTQMRNTEGEWKEKWRESMRIGQVRAWAGGSYNHVFSNTVPEQITQAFLISLGFTVKENKDRSETDDPLTWYHQFNCEDTFVPDFGCPDLKAVIEVHGCCIHGHDKSKCDRTAKYGFTKVAVINRKRDRRKYSFYKRHGWKWAIVWECEAKAGDFHRVFRDILGIENS